MFGMCLMLGSDPSLGSLDVSSFRTSNVTSMNGMFSYCTWLTSLDLSNFRTLLVEDMNGMFTFCTMLADLDVSQFDTSNVEDMRNMFDGCQSLKSLDLSKFNTAKITANATVNTMSAMFSNCEALRRVVLGPHFEFKGDSPSVRAESALPGLPEDQDHFGRWQAVGAGTEDLPFGDNFSSIYLAEIYDGATISDIYLWEPKAYTIHFDANGGTGTMPSINMRVGDSRTLPANTFIRTRYDFTGWVSDYGNTYANEGVMPPYSQMVGYTINLHAQWRQQTYKVVFDENKPAGVTGAVTGSQRISQQDLEPIRPCLIIRQRLTVTPFVVGTTPVLRLPQEALLLLNRMTQL